MAKSTGTPAARRRKVGLAGTRSLKPSAVPPLNKGDACLACRKRKVRCDAGAPCSACVRTAQHFGRQDLVCSNLDRRFAVPQSESQRPRRRAEKAASASPDQSASSHDEDEDVKEELLSYPEIDADVTFALFERLMGPTNLPPQGRPSSFASFDRSQPSPLQHSRSRPHLPPSFSPSLAFDSQPTSPARSPFATSASFPSPSPNLPSPSLDPYPPLFSQFYLFNSPLVPLSKPFPYSALASPFPSSLSAFAGPTRQASEEPPAICPRVLEGRAGRGSRHGE